MNKAWESFNRLVRDSETGEIVCEVEATHKKVAPLIAAAPDLLEACELAEGLITDAKCVQSVKWTEARTAIQQAIAKATGGEK